MSVGRSITTRSHAKCGKCNEWKTIATESWTTDQLKHHRVRGTDLVCRSCQSKVGESCEACNTFKETKAFDKGLLDEKRRTPTCLLICLQCAVREKDILARMARISAITCSCNCSTFRHAAACKWPQRGTTVTDDELTFVSFRPRTKKKYNL